MSAKLGATGAGAAGFSPLEVGWANAYWPGGPAFKALGYSDGQVMNDGETIPDEAGSYDLSPDSGAAETTLTYVASSNVNSKPGFRGTDTAGDHPPFLSSSFATPLGDDGVGLDASATGWSMVVIWNQGPQTSNTYGNVIHDVYSTSWFQIMANNDGSLYVRINSSTFTPAISWTSGDTIAVLVKGKSNLQYVDVDGTNYVNNTNAAIHLTGVNLFMYSTSWPFNGDLAFVGLYEGDCTGDAAWSDFETWALDELGATI